MTLIHPTARRHALLKRTRKRPNLHFPAIPRLLKGEAFFFASYILFLVYAILSISFFRVYIDAAWKPVFVFCIILLAVYEIVRNGMTLKNMLAVTVIALLFVNIIRIAGGMAQNSIAMLMAYMFCARHISFRKIAWYTILVSGIMLAFIVLSSYAGIIRNYVDPRKGRDREYLGFLYALNAPSIMSNITLLWVWYRKDRMRIRGLLGMALLNVFFYVKTDSRLCFFLTIAMLAYCLFLRRHEAFMLRRKILCWVMVLSFLLCFAGSYILTVRYNPNVRWMASLNKLLESRISLGKESLDKIGFRLLGIWGIQWVGRGLNMYGEASTQTYLYVDNYYIQVMQRFGLLFLLLILSVMTIASYRAYKRRDIFLLSIFCLLAGHFILDNLYMYLQYNTFWLAAGSLFFAGKRKDTQLLPGILTNETRDAA